LSRPEVAVEPIYVAGLGASTPVGRNPWSSAAAVRAGISGFVEHPYMIDMAGERMRVAAAPWLAVDLDGHARFEALLLPAIAQALSPVETAADPRMRVALALGLPSPRPGIPGDLERCLLGAISIRFPDRFTALASFEIGHAAGFAGMHAALAGMGAGAFEACVVVGVESYLAPESLEWLERHEQLHGAGQRKNPWGFVPGEGAGAALLVVESALARLGVEPLARVRCVGRGFEPNRIKTRTVCTGEGLTAAFRDALAGLPSGAKVTDIVCDMNGEPYRAEEFGFASLRTEEAFASASDFIAPAESWGDVSAASAPLAVMLAAIAGRKGYAKGPYALIWASSEGGERGATVLEITPAVTSGPMAEFARSAAE
jgi:3-oxoacyl-[acyl-carrier-protein] synthase-1